MSVSSLSLYATGVSGAYHEIQSVSHSTPGNSMNPLRIHVQYKCQIACHRKPGTSHVCDDALTPKARGMVHVSELHYDLPVPLTRGILRMSRVGSVVWSWSSTRRREARVVMRDGARFAG
jgi:hypothetical protein